MSDSATSPSVDSEKEKQDFRTAAWAVISVLILLYFAPTILYRWVGETTADRWADQLQMPPALAGNVYQCPPSPPTPKAASSRNAKADKKASPPPQLASVAVTAPKCVPLTQAEIQFLDQTERWLIVVGNFHLSVAKDLFKWQYLATLSALVAGTLTAASLLAISLQGLPSATLWMKSVFVVCSATAAFWIAVPQLYRYAANQSAALKGYSIASMAIWQIRAVRAGNLDGEGKWTDGPRFVSSLPSKLGEIGALSLSFDESKARLPDLKPPGT